MRSRSSAGIVLLIVLTLALAAPVAFIGARPAAAQHAAIKVGLIMPGTGPFTVNAERITTGVRVYFQGKDWQVAGRKIELTIEDDQGEP